MRVVFDHRKDEAPNISTFYFKPEKPVRYTAGQYIELTLPHENHDNRGLKRWFTLSSSPTDSLLSITTKFSLDRSSTFKQHLKNLSSKQELHMSDPMGDFVLPKIVQTPLLFVAGGIGITPYHSMLSWLISVKETRPIDLLFGVNNEEEIIFQDTFAKAHQHVTLMVNDPSPAWGGERGRLSSEFILGVGQPSKDTLIYISGPEPMVQALSGSLIKQGINRQKIVVDEFPNYTADY
jgi:ferredoxin-NADP reductase